MICGATFQKNREVNVNHIITASVNAVSTEFIKPERHLFISLWIAASVTIQLTSTHECQPSNFMIPSHINPMSSTNCRKDKKSFFITFVQQMQNIRQQLSVSYSTPICFNVYTSPSRSFLLCMLVTKLVKWKHLYKWLLQRINTLKPLTTA
jgi:hypothetical protein